MPRLVWLTTATLALALFASGARPSPAAACSRPAPEITVADVPANGVVVLSITCTLSPCNADEAPDVLPVVDAETGETVPGEVLRVEDEGWRIAVLWLPDAPLVVGRSYEVSWRPQSPDAFPFLEGIDYVFEAQPELEYDVTAASLGSELSMITDDSISRFECESVVIDSCGGHTTSISPAYANRPQLSVYFDPTLDPRVANAFELRGAFWADGETPPALGPATWATWSGLGHVYDAAAGQYCYRVELRSLIDDSSVVHEGCTPHGAIGAVETIEASSEELAQALQNCLEPPPGYEQEWCSGTRSRCAAAAANGWVADGCDIDLDSRCGRAEPAPQPAPNRPPVAPPTAGTTPDPQPTGPSAGAPAPAPEDDTASSDVPKSFRRKDEPRSAKYGCSAGASAAHASWDALALACAVLAIRARRRRPG